MSCYTSDSLRQDLMGHRHHHRRHSRVKVVDVTCHVSDSSHHRRHSSLSSLEADEKSQGSSSYQLEDVGDEASLSSTSRRTSYESGGPAIAILASSSPEIRALCKSCASLESLTPDQKGLQLPMTGVPTSQGDADDEQDENLAGQEASLQHNLWPSWTLGPDKNPGQDVLLKPSSQDETNSTAASTTDQDTCSLHLSPATDVPTPRVSLSPLERSLASLSFVSPSSFSNNDSGRQNHRDMDPASLHANTSSSTLPARLRGCHRRVSYDMLPTPDQIAAMTPRSASYTFRNNTNELHGFQKATIHHRDSTPPRHPPPPPPPLQRGASAPTTSSSGRRPRHRRNTAQIVLPPQI